MENVYTKDQLSSPEKCYFCGLVQALKLFVAIISGHWVCERCYQERKH